MLHSIASARLANVLGVLAHRRRVEPLGCDDGMSTAALALEVLQIPARSGVEFAGMREVSADSAKLSVAG